MRLRTQNLLLIVPLFAALGLGMAVPARTAVEDELDWAMREAAAALVVSVAEFAASPVGQDPLALERHFEELLSFDQALEIALLDDRGTPWVHAGRRGQDALMRLPIAASGRDSVAVAIPISTDSTVTLDAWATIGAGGHPRAHTAAVRIDASWTLPFRARLERNFGLALLLIVGAGFFTAIVLSRRLERQLEPLRLAAEAVADGVTELHLPDLQVREANDLADTLTTVAEILQSSLERGRRRLTEGVTLTRSLARQLGASLLDAPRRAPDHGTGFAAREIGRPQPGDFAGMLTTADAVTWAWCGTVTRSDKASEAFIAQAAQAVVRHHLESAATVEPSASDLEHLTHQLVDLLALDGLAVAAVRHESGHSEVAAMGRAHASIVEPRIVLDVLSADGHAEALRGTALIADRPASAVAELLTQALAPVHSGIVCVVVPDEIA